MRCQNSNAILCERIMIEIYRGGLETKVIRVRNRVKNAETNRSSPPRAFYSGKKTSGLDSHPFHCSRTEFVFGFGYLQTLHLPHFLQQVLLHGSSG
ncbi:hypothetical protein TNCT_530331 [Trichonephila clavata]|uniref:Uncharacterized protein n=1 Tax=Trichonephila clavata TaxID=2740835 RepID=A0A8X6L1X6_TRICU|nr:hypothetical protein TNCT_530331 [Trichonephila clavata]